ncbi:MAG: metallophosphoesterase family protein [Planctomycetes bacterium]|nr:metallophosphoesterase family protein [Planctomycetota bacterium]
MRRPSLALAITVFLFAGRAVGQDHVGVFLTWPDDPTRGMVVNWVNLYPKNATTVFFRRADAADDADWSSAEAEELQLAPSALVLRRVELAGLAPDTLYRFGIGSRPDTPSQGWLARTMPATLSRPVRFVAGGDMMHARESLDRMNRQAARLDPDFALLGGDLAYENGALAMRWIDWLSSWTTAGAAADRRLIPLVIGIGNHEVRGGYGGAIPNDAPYYYGLFVRPGGRSHFAADVGDYLSLVMLDSGHTVPIPAQADWLGEALAARQARPFLFAAYHFPAYGTAKAPADKLPIEHPRSVEIREHWTPHLERHGVSAVFEHDHHTFKRSHRLRGHRRDDTNGILYLGDGAWGVRTRPVPSPEAAWWLARAEARNHLWCVNLRPGAAGGPPTALVRAIDADGVVFDEFELLPIRTRPEAQAEPVTAAD